MKNIGIWLDTNKALIITIDVNVESMETVLSNIEHYHIRGGAGTRLKGGPQDVVQDSKFLEREKHQTKKYFKEIVSKIKTADALAIFGPAGTNFTFKKELEDFYKELNQKVKIVEKADSMTTNQVKALVRDFFKGK